MTRVRRFALPLMVIAVMGALPPSLFAQRTFEGVYIASGLDSAGNEYRRAVEIERHDERFIVTWVSARLIGESVVLEPTWIGVGIVTGETLSVSFVCEASSLKSDTGPSTSRFSLSRTVTAITSPTPTITRNRRGSCRNPSAT